MRWRCRRRDGAPGGLQFADPMARVCRERRLCGARRQPRIMVRDQAGSISTAPPVDNAARREAAAVAAAKEKITVT